MEILEFIFYALILYGIGSYISWEAHKNSDAGKATYIISGIFYFAATAVLISGFAVGCFS